MIVGNKTPISEILAGLESRAGPRSYDRRDLRMPRETYDHDREVILKTMREHEPKTIAGGKGVRVRDDDGLTFYLADGAWALLRVSGTEPLVRLSSRAEAKDALEPRLHTLQQAIGAAGAGR